jgi:hypothetical protein
MNSLESDKNLATYDHIAARGCWRASLRDWLTGHTCVWLGHLIRFDLFWRARRQLLSLVALEDFTVRAQFPAGIEPYLPFWYTNLPALLVGFVFEPMLASVFLKWCDPGPSSLTAARTLGFMPLLPLSSWRGKER